MTALLLFFFLNANSAYATDRLQQYENFQSLYQDKFPNASYALDAFNNLDYESCIEIGKLSAALSPKSPDPHFVMGRCYERLLDFELASKDYQTVILLDPNYKDVHNNLVLMSFKMLNFDKAHQQLNVWKKLAPNDRRIAGFEKVLIQLPKDFKDDEKSLEAAKKHIKKVYRATLKQKPNTFKSQLEKDLI